MLQKNMLKFALLSASFLLVTGYAITYCIPDYQKLFVGYSDAAIEFLVTISALAVMVVMFISDFVSRLIGKKNTVLLGLVVVTASSFMSAMVTSYEMMFVSRLIFGVGLGLINALAISMIDDFFTGNECATMMGLRNAVEGFGQTALVAIAGFVYESYGYAYVPYVYLSAVPIFLIFMLFVPSDDKTVTAKSETKVESAVTSASGGKTFIPLNALPHCLILLFTVLVSVGFFIKIHPLLQLNNLDESHASSLMTAISFCTMAGGCIFGIIYKKIKYFSLLAALLLTGLSCLILVMASNVTVFYLACCINGLAYPLIISYIFNMIGSLSKRTSNILVTSWMLIGCNVGAFAAPAGFVLISTISGNQSTEFAFLCFGVIFLVILALSIVFKKHFIIEQEMSA